MEKEYCITYRKHEKVGWIKTGWVNHYFTVVAHQKKGAIKSFWNWAGEFAKVDRLDLINVFVEYRKR